MERERLKEILQRLGVPYKDVNSKAVNVNCPFCRGSTRGLPDDKNRCGIFPVSLRYHCFRCNRVGGLYELLNAIVGITETAFRSLVGHLRPDESLGTLADRVRRKLAPAAEPESEASIPSCMPPGEPIEGAWHRYPEVKYFLRRRRIDVDTCVDYHAVYTGRTGPNAYRLAWPLLAPDGTLMAWQGRDVTNKLKYKYHSEGPVGKVLYWSRRAGNGRVYVVEGVLDCWRMGENAVATLSHQISLEQQRQLLFDHPGLREVVFAWDGDSFIKSQNAARHIAPIIKAGAVKLPERMDPDKLGGDVVRELEVWWA